MTHSEERDDFIDSANSRETSVEIMIAIASIARNIAHAERIWQEPLNSEIEDICHNLEQAPSFYHWGAAGNDWL